MKLTQDYIEGQSTTDVFIGIIDFILVIISILIYVFIVGIIFTFDIYDRYGLDYFCKLILTFYTYFKVYNVRTKLLNLIKCIVYD